jgi:hypothetical protein
MPVLNDEILTRCRRFAYLAITIGRCMNILARYCIGYLGDIGAQPAFARIDQVHDML